MKGKFKVIISLILSLMLALSLFTACKDDENGGGGGGDNPPPTPDKEYSVQLDKTTYTMGMIEQMTLVATVKEDGVVVENPVVTWGSSDDNIVSVVGGVVSSHKQGTAKITATAYGKSAECSVTVTADKIPMLSIGVGDAGSVALLLNKDFLLQPEIVYSNQRFNDAEFAYSSNDTSIATVNTDGLVVGKAIGETKVVIKASWRGFGEDVLTEIIDVKVTEDLLVKIDDTQTTLLASTAAQIVGYNTPNTVQLSAIVRHNGIDIENANITWSSSNEDVATVTQEGLVTGVSEGDTNISIVYTQAEEKVYQSIPLAISVEFPYLDKTEDIAIPDVDASLALGTTGAKVLANDVFQSNIAITEIKDTATSKTIAVINDGVDAVIKSQTLDSGNRVWEVRNLDYAFKVSVFVATKIIADADSLLEIFTYTAPDKIGVPYGANTHYILGDNIDASGKTHKLAQWIELDDGGGFRGMFDGRGYTINGLTLQSGGLFGHLGEGSTVKNFALTGVTLSGKTASALADRVFKRATIENVFIEVINASATDRIAPFANYIRGNDTVGYPSVKDVVMVVTVPSNAGFLAPSFTDKLEPGNTAAFSNVHVISDAKLFSKNGNTAGLSDTTTKTPNNQTEMTRYGVDGHYATFKTRFADMAEGIPVSGLNDKYWDFSGDYPQFKTFLPFIEANIDSAIDAIPNSLDFACLTGGEYSVPFNAGEVELTLNPVTYEGITIDGRTITVANTILPSQTAIKLTVASLVTGYSKEVTINITTANITAAFDALPDTKSFTAGTADSFTIPEAAGTVTITLNPQAYEGVTVNDRTITIGANVSAGSVVVKVASTITNDTKDITVEFVAETKTVTTAFDISQDVSDTTTLNYQPFTASDNFAVRYMKDGDAGYTAISAENITFGVGTLDIAKTFLKTLSAGNYKVQVAAGSELIIFENVLLVTNILNDYTEFKATFKYPAKNSTPMTYGLNEYYILGDNIDAGGTQHNRAYWISGFPTDGKAGFRGTFDGRGFTVDNIKLLMGGVFGHLGAGSVVKNFAITNIVFDNVSNGENEALCIEFGKNAVVQNIFMHVKDITENGASGHVRPFASVLRGNKGDAADYTSISDVVMYVKFESGRTVATGKDVMSFASGYSTGNYALLDNVHIISDFTLFKGTDTPVLTTNQITRYGVGATNATFGAKYPIASTTVESLGLDANYWTYEGTMAYPVFTSAVANITF